MRTRKQRTKRKRILTYTAFFEPADEGGYVVTVPALPGCATQGETFEDAKRMAQGAIRLYLKVLREDGEEVPIEKENEMARLLKTMAGHTSLENMDQSTCLDRNR